MRHTATRYLAVLIVTLGLGTAHNAAAQSPTEAWPQHTVRLIVPLSPGTATDVTARLYAEKLSARWGKPVIVENKPGPDALAAVNALTTSRDQHTLLFSFGGPVTVNPILYDKLPYDPQRDLVPIVSATDSFIGIAANTASGITSLRELQARARAAPGKLNWAATSGMPQFVFTIFLKSAGITMTYVPYRDFTPALQDVSEGRITVVATGLLPLLTLLQGGKAHVLAVTNHERSSGAPQIPTTTEAGFPDVVAPSFQGFFGWRDMPDALRDRIAADVRAAARDMPADRLAKLGQVVRVGTTADFIAMIKEQRALVQAAVKAGGFNQR
jgi:tripartite-type tricarboxylate transporter receptor subunit TctC